MCDKCACCLQDVNRMVMLFQNILLCLDSEGLDDKGFRIAERGKQCILVTFILSIEFCCEAN